MLLVQLSAGFQSLPPLPTSKLGPSGADSWVCVCVRSRPLWVSPMSSPVRLVVFPIAAPPTGVLRGLRLYFPAGALGLWVYLAPQLLLLVHLQVNMGLPSQQLPPHQVTSRCLATSPLGPAARLRPSCRLGECFFFISLVVRLLYSSIFCQFWLFFVFKFVVALLLFVRGDKVYLPTPPSWPEV